MVTDRTRRPGLHHTVDFFDSDAELSRLMAESVKDGVDRSESVLVTVSDGQERQIRSLLGTAADSVHFAPADHSYVRPPAAMYDLVTFLTEQLKCGHTRVRSIGAASISPAEFPEWIRYEACINEVLAAAPLTGVCLYDTRALTDDHRPTVEQTHPHRGGTATGASSENYLDPHQILKDFPARSLLPGRQPDLILHHVTEVRPVRTVAADLAPPGRGADVAMVIHELTTLALETGPGSPQVRMWREPHSLVVRVTGSPVFDDPFAGWRPPQTEGNPAALWIARQLADDFSVDPSGPIPAATMIFFGSD